MKFSEKWLRSWCDPDINIDAMVEQLTMAGLEVDGVEAAAGEFTDVVVALIESIEKHPDADKLNVCQVSDGQQSLQIVCGASNVRAGGKFPLARIGAVLPGQNPGETFKIKPAKLRGVESSGMLCSDKELGLAESADGLLELADNAPVGTNLREYLNLDDNIIEIDLTPNRGDCLSISGVARELGVLNRCDVNTVEIPQIASESGAGFEVRMNAPEACTHYVGRVIEGVDVKAETPLWMVECLRRSGIRSLGAIVDITNYVMLELGQPMHAFDLATLDTAIDIRYASQGEKITLLDGKVIELDEQTLLISDAKQPLALAGIMGGENSGVTDDTTSIFLESAFFKPEVIAGKARSYGLHTDSSHRFERGVDPDLQVKALQRASELVLQFCGGQAGPVIENTTKAHRGSNPAIELRRRQISRLLGIEIADNEIEAMLQRLGMSVQGNDQGWTVVAPSFRFDINIEADLLEEIVRIHGYNNIPRHMPLYYAAMQPLSELRTPLSRLKQALVERGYHEAVTYSFVEPATQALIDPQAQGIELANPISSEMSVMRTSIWTGLLTAVRHNLNRQHGRVRLFESGLCFTRGEQGIEQQAHLAGAITGNLTPDQWGESERKVDFFDVKADVESLLQVRGISYEFIKADNPALHPGQSASILSGDRHIGWVGALHPELQGSLDIEHAVYLFDLEQQPLLEAKLPAFQSLSRFPEVRRDLAVVVDAGVAVGDMQAAMRSAASELVRDVLIFDIYTGQGIDAGQKSVAFGLILQDFSRTLTDNDIDQEVDQIVRILKTEFTATLRE